MTHDELIAAIRYRITEEEIFCQLAEEAAELAQAALKYRRALTGKNPTPVTLDEAAGNMFEEIGDVKNCLDLLGYLLEFAQSHIDEKREDKLLRMLERLKGKV